MKVTHKPQTYFVIASTDIGKIVVETNLSFDDAVDIREKCKNSDEYISAWIVKENGKARLN